LKRGQVIKSTGSWYSVRDEEGKIVPCKIKGAYRIKGLKRTNPVAVGDWVSFLWKPTEESGVIQKIEERRNYIIRKSINLSKQSQIIAANIDMAFLVVTIVKPETTTTFVDRFLASAEAYRIPVTLVFNKIDLYDTTELKLLEQWITLYSGIGYACLKTSAIKGSNMDQLIKIMRGKVCVISGNSGVGKSMLIKWMDPDVDIKVGDISDYHQKGRHTTTYPEMHFLSTGSSVIDTPGIKGFGRIDMDREEVFHFFPEIFAHSANCQFHNCLHLDEPNCSVKQALVDGTIAPSRYESYISLLDEDPEKKYRE
jgi:ribosome biogenesis GTPase